ncbi:hypothetical protein [Aliivibrio fischeri]|uniref:hypothetical protein n=1 Tax=Aliivibrio fischeri TaxID=668 RepID=UPI0007C44F17|nr:hypothetical protein [Aliivibrio fischeri]
MKLSDKTTLIILFILMLIFFYAGQATNSEDITSWKLLVEFSSVLTSFATIGMLFIAYKALDGWKKQIHGQLIQDSALELEEKLTKYVMACGDEADKLKNNPELLLYKDIINLCFRLRRRGFNVEVIISIEEALNATVEALRETSSIPENLIGNLFDALTRLSKSF